jgi:protein involved in polysaccharide export with SLBB domain
MRRLHSFTTPVMRVLSASMKHVAKPRLKCTGLRLAAALLMAVMGCTATQTGRSVGVQTNSESVQQSSATSASETQRLEELRQKRTRDSFGADFTLGPGDLLEISVPLEELEQHEVRVSPRDSITLPLVGTIQVNGMTEQNLIDDLRRRLGKYMYDPPVSLFVKQYGSRQVAVVGAVVKPGLFTLMSGSDTLMEMISKAGGMNQDAAARVIFVPAEASEGSLQLSSLSETTQWSDTDPQTTPRDSVRRVARAPTEKIASAGPGKPDMTDPHTQMDLFEPAVAKLHPIVISTTDPGAQTWLGIPARPGDVLIVPSAGEVTVGGWVHGPGAYKVTTGMTALSAISAAGGPLFSYSAEVLRTDRNGQRLSIPVDISKVQKGEEVDVPVQSGDVVMVDKSAAGAVPYAFYVLFQKVGTGLAVPIP